MAEVNNLINIINKRESNNTSKEKLHPQIQEKINYINSPIYKRRLMALGQSKKDAESLIKERVNVLKNTELRPYSSSPIGDWTGGGSASKDPKTNRPYISYDTTKSNAESIFAHELGHLTSGVENPDNKYYPYPLTEGKETIEQAKQRVEKMLSEGTPMYMSPKEEMLFNLQNKNLNELPKKGFGIHKMTGGKSLNDYFYNSKGYKGDWPLGTNVDINEPNKKENNFLSGLKIGYRNYTDINSLFNQEESATDIPMALAPVKKTMALTKNKEYDYKFLNEMHNFSEQGVPKSHLAKTGYELMYKLDPHQYSPTENKADLDAIRHLLKKNKYTSNYGDDITPELWERALKDKKINQNEHLKRMRRNFDDKAIINLNNRVAKNNKKEDKNRNQV